jgi:hypothetical protein
MYSEEMLTDIRNQCGTGAYSATVLGFDRTFKLSSCYVTITVYKNKNLYRNGKLKFLFTKEYIFNREVPCYVMSGTFDTLFVTQQSRLFYELLTQKS